MKTQNPLIGRARGQAGGLVASTWNGRNILRARPFEVRNPNTGLQRVNRQNNTLNAGAVSAVLDFIKQYWVRKVLSLPVYNEVLSVAAKIKSYIPQVPGNEPFSNTTVNSIPSSQGLKWLSTTQTYNNTTKIWGVQAEANVPDGVNSGDFMVKAVYGYVDQFGKFVYGVVDGSYIFTTGTGGDYTLDAQVDATPIPVGAQMRMIIVSNAIVGTSQQNFDLIIATRQRTA